MNKLFQKFAVVLTTIVLAIGMVSIPAAIPTHAQNVSTLPGQIRPNNAIPPASLTYQAGTESASSTTVTLSPGPIICAGSSEYMAAQTFTVPSTVSSTTPLYVYFQCPSNQTFMTSAIQQGTGGVNILIGSLYVVSSTVTYTDLRSTQYFPVVSDWSFWVPESACGGAVSGTGGSGNATDIVALSGGLRVFRLSNTNAGASTNTFTCTFEIPSKVSAGKLAYITDIAFLVSPQTTIPTSIGTPTVKTYTAPAPSATPTANSATFVAYGGTITTVPTSTQFAALSAVNAGQFYTVDVVCGTPAVLPADLTGIQLVIAFGQTASSAGVQETPGFFVHGVIWPL
jgi:hypothetical protein